MGFKIKYRFAFTEQNPKVWGQKWYQNVCSYEWNCHIELTSTLSLAHIYVLPLWLVWGKFSNNLLLFHWSDQIWVIAFQLNLHHECFTNCLGIIPNKQHRWIFSISTAVVLWSIHQILYNQTVHNHRNTYSILCGKRQSFLSGFLRPLSVFQIILT